MSLRVKFLSFFRELFLYNSSSLEFRAKIYAAILLPKEQVGDKDYKILKEIADEIYPKQSLRAELLVNITKEYIFRVNTYKEYTLDRLLKDIDFDLKHNKKFIQKINFQRLRRLISAESQGYALVQQRVYEFLIKEVEIYS